VSDQLVFGGAAGNRTRYRNLADLRKRWIGRRETTRKYVRPPLKDSDPPLFPLRPATRPLRLGIDITTMPTLPDGYRPVETRRTAGGHAT
jgi:hypothetical protein